MTAIQEVLGSPESVGAWSLVPERSTIEFRSRSLWGLVTVRGRFTQFHGDGEIAETASDFNGAIGSRTVVGKIDIAAASLDTKIGKRDAHLRSGDFFEVTKFPRIRVAVSGLQRHRGDTAELRAELTVRGITADLPLSVTVTPLNTGIVRLTTQSTINRKDFGVNGNLLGMVVDATTLLGDVVFRRAAG